MPKVTVLFLVKTLFTRKLCQRICSRQDSGAATAIAKKKSGDYDKKGFRKTKYKNPDSPNIKSNEQRRKELAEDLRKWFAQKWVRMNTKGNIKGRCARDPGEGKPKCLPQAKAQSLGKEGRASGSKTQTQRRSKSRTPWCTN
jgi:hypothetical protein